MIEQHTIRGEGKWGIIGVEHCLKCFSTWWLQWVKWVSFLSLHKCTVLVAWYSDDVRW